MIFGSAILGADVLSVPNAMSNISNITSCTIGNAYINDFFITENTEYILDNTVPMEWDNDTILHAKYDDDTGLTAGSVNFRFEDIAGRHMLIKRRIKDSMKWITLHAYYIRLDEEDEQGNIIRHYEDLLRTFIDYTCAPGVEYEYALVPVLEGGEGSYYISSITPETDKLVICTAYELWSTLFTDGKCDNQRNTAPGVVNTLNDKYPTIIDNSISNYETVNVTAQFFPSEDGCHIDIDPENPSNMMRLLKRFKDFLMNRKNKFLKNTDGRMWFCYVTTPPSDNARDIYWDREITFGVTEVADVEDEEALYGAGFISATSEWWNKK